MEITSSFGVHQVKHQRAPQIKELDVISEYNYLGAILDNKASMRSHLKTLKKKCFYLERKALFYAHKLSLKNQYLLWMIYIRTHFGYCSGFLDTQTRSLQQNFEVLYRASFKRFLHLPASTPAYITDMLLEPFDQFTKRIQLRIETKIQSRYSSKHSSMPPATETETNTDEKKELQTKTFEISKFDRQKIESIPEDFMKLLRLSGSRCTCHNAVLSFTVIMMHLSAPSQQEFVNTFLVPNQRNKDKMGIWATETLKIILPIN